MKIILISNCSNCPHGALWDLDLKQYMCAEKGKVNPDVKDIPDWCPLQDAKTVIRGFLKEINRQNEKA